MNSSFSCVTPRKNICFLEGGCAECVFVLPLDGLHALAGTKLSRVLFAELSNYSLRVTTHIAHIKRNHKRIVPRLAAALCVCNNNFGPQLGHLKRRSPFGCLFNLLGILPRSMCWEILKKS